MKRTRGDEEQWLLFATFADFPMNCVSVKKLQKSNKKRSSQPNDDDMENS